MQDRRVLPVWSRAGQRLRPLREGEVTPVAFLYGRGPLTDLLKTESLSVRADQYHIAPEQNRLFKALMISSSDLSVNLSSASAFLIFF